MTFAAEKVPKNTASGDFCRMTTLTVLGWDFGDGSDKAVINGTMRLPGNLDNIGKLHFSGSGIVAMTATDYATVKSDPALGLPGDVSFSGQVALVNAGAKESTVCAIRTRKEEPADNTAAKARRSSGETDMGGWLSGTEDEAQGKFADTEDWIRYDNFDSLTYGVSPDTISRHDDVTVEVWKNGTRIQNVAWNGYTKRFTVDNSAFADGAEYLLHLKIAEGTEAPAYTFCRM